MSRSRVPSTWGGDLRGAGACRRRRRGTGACSGDLLLGALAACAQITCQMVAETMGLAINDIAVTVEGDLDLRGMLGIDREAPIGFADIRRGHADAGQPAAIATTWA